MNRNIKLSPSLIALTWDVIFVWTISTLYFTQVKGLSNSQAVLLDSILMLFGCLFVVPVTKLFQNVSSIKSTRVGLFGFAAYLLICIFGQNFATFIFAQPFLAFGYALMGVKSNSVLTESLHVVKRDKDYQRIYGKGLSFFYVFECVGAILITYVYEWKPTMVYWLSLLIVGACFLLSLLFKDPNKFMTKNVDIDAKVVDFKQLKKPDSFKKLLMSSFLIFLLAYGFFYRGILSISGSSFRIYLNTLIGNGIIPIWLYGYLYAGSRITNIISSKYQFKLNLKFGVRSLIILNVLLILTFIGCGVAYIMNPISIISIVIIVILSWLQCALRMPNQIFLNNYLQVCTSRKNQERVMSIKIMVEYMGYAILSATYSALLAGFNDNYGITSLVYVSIFAIPLVISLVLFIRALCKKHAQKYTVIKDEYTKD